MKQILLEWAVTASLLILAVVVLRALLGRRIGAGLRYALWAVVLVRLLVPLQLISLPVPAAALPDLDLNLDREPAIVSPSPADPVPPLQGELIGVPAIAAPQPSGVVTNYTAVDPSDVALKAEPLPVLQVLGGLWLAGALVMAAAFLLSNLAFALRLRRARTALECADCPLPVYLAEGLPSPCLFGLVRPAVYVTGEAVQDPAMLRHVLAHEYTHFRHGDHLWNVLRSAALAAHWWNPLVWLAVVLSRRDCELACDEGALKRLGDEERFAYGRTLVSLITVKPRPGDLLRCATTMTGGQKSVFDRVNRIARAPRRWLGAAVAAVLITALACACAFGHGLEAPAPEDTDNFGLAADLTFSFEMGEQNSSTIRIDGTVGGVELTRGAFWHLESVWGEEPFPELSMVYPPFTDSIEGRVVARWADEGRTSVTLSTWMMPALSSLFNTGSWEFTVELSSGTVTKMESSPSQDGSEIRLYPESIPDEEAVKAARIAAKLLTAAEEYYNENSPQTNPEPSVPPATLTLSTQGTPVKLSMDGYTEDCVLIEGLTWGDARWFAPSEGSPLGDLFLEGFPLSGDNGTLSLDIYWTDESRTAVTGGTWLTASSYSEDIINTLIFTVDLADGGAVTHKEGIIPRLNERDPERTISDEDAVAIARVAAELLTAAENYYCANTTPKDPAPITRDPFVSLLDPGSCSFSLSEYGTPVSIHGLDCGTAYWYLRTHNASPDMPETILGELQISGTQFLGEEFTDVYRSVLAHYAPEENQLWMHVSENEYPGSRNFLVDLTARTVTELAVDPKWAGSKPIPCDQVLGNAAQTLSQLIQETWDFYQASLVPEEGPLPFDVPMKLQFASGAGGWDTLLTLHPDGSFEGRHHDSDMGVSGRGYDSTEYICRFHGRFGDITQVTAASWSLTLEELILDTGHPIGEEWIEVMPAEREHTYNLRYISSAPYGFDGSDGGPLKPGAQFMFYTPEARGYAPTDELYGMTMENDWDSGMYQFWTWWPDKHEWSPDSTLGSYGLCNMETGYGFFSFTY